MSDRAGDDDDDNTGGRGGTAVFSTDDAATAAVFDADCTLETVLCSESRATDCSGVLEAAFKISAAGAGKYDQLDDVLRQGRQEWIREKITIRFCDSDSAK